MKPTIAEYKSYIRELKLRMKQLAVKNKELTKLVAQSRVNTYLHGKKPKATTEDLIRAQKNVIFIQKNIRGFLARKEFENKLAKVIEEKPTQAVPKGKKKKHFSNEMMSNEKVMKKFESATAQKNMTPEMIFRMVDEDQNGQVQTYRFSLFVKSLGFALTNAEVTRLGNIFDEDCSGEISLKEYLLSLSAFGIAKESSTHKKLFGDQFGGRTLGQILLIKFGALLRNNNMNAERFVRLAMGDQNSNFKA
jgi:Ca2+-binding EF-hand superfamily protein